MRDSSQSGLVSTEGGWHDPSAFLGGCVLFLVFCSRVHPLAVRACPGHYHKGMDIDCENGDDIAAAEPGTVSEQLGGEDVGYGYYREVNHGVMYVELLDGFTTSYGSAVVTSRYAHLLSNSNRPAGSWLDQGAFVGDGDCTGSSSCSHLHFEVLEGGTQVNPRNYLP